MTCSLNVFGRIDNLNNIIKFLNAKDTSNDENDRLLTRDSVFVQKSNKTQLDWSNDWLNDDANNESDEPGDEPTESKEVKTESKPDPSEGWLDSLLVSVSPCGNFAVFAKMQTILTFRARMDQTGQLRFQYESKIRINENEKEFITSIICVPIASQKKTGDGLPEWTCIIAGFNTGNIRIYSENGLLLTNQMFHDDTILKLKCRSYEPAKYIGWINQPEEIEILYANNVLVCIDGLNLYQFLKAARIFSSKSNDLNEMNNMLASLNLDYKKWKLENQELITDFVSAGFTSENRFDQLFSASSLGGPYEKFESIPPVANRYLTCGNMPYVCFFSAMEGMGPTVFSDVAKQVAGRVTSAFMNAAKGWMGFNKQPQVQQQKPKPKIELPTPLSARFGLPDYRRNGESIIISPANNFAATSDSFGRVILIDVNKGLAIRVFKGYRDAQIAWFCVDDESEDKVNKRYALYLVIYAPRRGLLEVWGCQQGIRVAAFNVGKNAKLFYPGYFMFSLNGSLITEDCKTKKSIQCYLISEDGLIKTLQIPFHLILSDKSNQRVRDTILLKKIKFILRENTSESDQIWSSLMILLRDFKTPSIKQQALERLTNTSYLSVSKIFEVISHELEQIEKNSDGQSNDSNKLAQLCEFYHRLIKSYIFLGEIKPSSIQAIPAEGQIELSPAKEDEKAMADVKSFDHSEFILKSLSSFLKLDETDLANYFEIRKVVNEKKAFMDIEAKDTKPLSLPKYLSKFEFPTQGLSSQTIVSIDGSRPSFYFRLSKSITIKEKQQLGYFLFKNFFADDAAYDEEYLLEFIRMIPIRKLDLLELLVHTWLDERFSNNVTMFKVFGALCGSSTSLLQSQSSVKFTINSTEGDTDSKKLIEDEPIVDDDGGIEIFVDEYLPKLRRAIETNSSILESLYLTWILRSVLVQVEADALLIESYSILSNRLFSLAKFYRLLLCGDRFVFDYYISREWFTLRNILSKGKGILSEITAKHCILNEFSPKLLNIIDLDDEDLAGSDKEGAEPAKMSETDKEEAQIRRDNMLLLENETNKEFYDCLQETRSFVPKSLESDTILVNCAWEAIELFDSNNSASSGIKYLDLSLRYCGEIGNAILKQGILSMIWHSHLCKRVSKLTDLIDKVGKAPKERYLLKEVSITEDSLIKFLECIMTFLDLIMDANCSVNEVPIFNYDQFWKGDVVDLSSTASLDMPTPTPSIPEPKFFSYPIGGKQASSSASLSTSSGHKLLVEVASEQKPINYHLCLFHYQLIRILYLIVKYNMKNIKPYSFFDTKGKNALFSELFTHPLITNDVDIKILNARKLFLTKVMNSMLDDVEQPASIKSKLPKETVDHLSIIFNLSKELGVDLEFIKRYYCCVLYAFDYHSEAEKVLQTVRERELIASQLLVVVGNKINEILKTSPNASLMAILSTNLRSWLKSLGSPEYRIYTTASKQPLLELMGSILDKLPESFSEHKLATELFDFIDNPQFQIK